MIEIRNVSKKFGDKYAVRDLDLTVRPGLITGFLGPNGSGKSTTIRMIIGLDRPTAGEVLINGRPFAAERAPLRTIGALIDAKGAQGGRSAYKHLQALAMTNGLPRRRVDEVIEIVGLTDVAKHRVGSFSLGMGQRVGIAAALLGDPETVILDEPVNGLDPEGILWIRTLMRSLAREGRTVFVSSHLMSEMALTADHLVVIGRGELLADMPMSDFIERSARASVLARSPQAGELAEVLLADGATVQRRADGSLEVTGLDAAQVGDLAGASGIYLHELSTHRSSLEEAFMAMTHESVEYQARGDLTGTGLTHAGRPTGHDGQERLP